MENHTLEESLPLSVQSNEQRRESQNSLKVNISQASSGKDSVSKPMARRLSFLEDSQPMHFSFLEEPQAMHFAGSLSLPATPPADPDPATDGQLFDGVGGRFGDTLPPRAPWLSTEGDSVASSTNAWGLHTLNEEAAKTPLKRQGTWGNYPWLSRYQAEPSPLTPGLTSSRQQTSSPPSAPRPAKRPKTEHRPAHKDSWPRMDLGEDSQAEDDSRDAFIDEVFRHATQLSANLAEMAGYLAENRETTQEAFDFFAPLDNEAAKVPKSQQVAQEPVDFFAPLGSQVNEVLAKGEARLEALGLCAPMDKPAKKTPKDGHVKKAERATKPRYGIEVEYASEDEIEAHLAGLLLAYRAFYLEGDEPGPSMPRDPAAAREARHALKLIFEDQLSSARDEEFLLQGEDEDILDTFMTWIREKRVLHGICEQSTGDLRQCLEHLGRLGAMPFANRIVMSVITPHGPLFTAQLPIRFDVAISSELDVIHDAFLEMAQLAEGLGGNSSRGQA